MSETSDADRALLEFSGSTARFRAFVRGTRRPARSRWQKWRLCRERLADYSDLHAKHEGLRYAAVELRYWDHAKRYLMLEKRYRQATERYRRMLWGRQPFRVGQTR